MSWSSTNLMSTPSWDAAALTPKEFKKVSTSAPRLLYDASNGQARVPRVLFLDRGGMLSGACLAEFGKRSLASSRRKWSGHPPAWFGRLERFCCSRSGGRNMEVLLRITRAVVGN